MKPDTESLVKQFKALADPTRLRLLALCCHGECSVSELTRLVGQSQPRVSQQLKKLSDAGLLQRFRDGNRVYYHVPMRGAHGLDRRQILSLLPDDEIQVNKDLNRLAELRGQDRPQVPASPEDRALYRAILDLSATRPVGDLLDIGCGSGRLLKLLGATSRRAVGVDIDSGARHAARYALLSAGMPQCTIRQGDMLALPFGDDEFDTLILDDVLGSAEDPVRAFAEANRVLRPEGRILVLASTAGKNANAEPQRLAQIAVRSGMRLSPPRRLPQHEPQWLLSVAMPATPKGAL
jgi:ArsR family transcriptional regulator